MARVLSLVTFHIDHCHRDEFLRRAEDELKPFWEAKGSQRYEVYEEMGPTGPTGRLVEMHVLADRDSYAEMSALVQSGEGLPEIAYRHVKEPAFQVMELRI